MADNIQHGIDDSSTNDAEKGAALGGLGGAAVGAAAGSLAGPLGTVVGAVAGGLIGAGASGAAVAAVDQIDNDDTVSGIGDPNNPNLALDSNDARLRGHGTTPVATTTYGTTYDPMVGAATVPAVHTVDPDVTADVPGGHNVVTGGPATTNAGTTGLAAGAIAGGLVGTAIGGPVGAVVGGTLGSLAGGVAGDAAEASDAEGIASDEDIAAANNYSGAAYQAQSAMNPAISPVDTHPINDNALKPSTQTDYRNVDSGLTSVGATDQNADIAPQGGLSTPGITPGVRVGNDVPGIQTGGVTTQGPDTRGITEKAADAITGDNVDDKTGGRILNDKANGNY